MDYKFTTFILLLFASAFLTYSLVTQEYSDDKTTDSQTNDQNNSSNSTNNDKPNLNVNDDYKQKSNDNNTSSTKELDNSQMEQAQSSFNVNNDNEIELKQLSNDQTGTSTLDVDKLIENKNIVEVVNILKTLASTNDEAKLKLAIAYFYGKAGLNLELAYKYFQELSEKGNGLANLVLIIFIYLIIIYNNLIFIIIYLVSWIYVCHWSISS